MVALFHAAMSGALTRTTTPSRASSPTIATINEYGQYFWADSANGRADMPTIGQVRGKIVLWAFNGRHGGWLDYGFTQLANDPSTYIQDDYNIPTLVDIAAKWNAVSA